MQRLSQKRVFTGTLFAIATSAVPAVGQVFTVSSNADTDTPGTLRYALTQANAYSGAATINFDAGLGTITLTSELPILENPNGITINGNGDTVNGGSTSNTTGYRVFFVGVSTAESAADTGYGSLAATTSTNWSISNLTIQDGNARGGSGGGGGAGLGGAIFVNAGTLTVTDVSFSDNLAVGGNGGNGGAGGGMGGNGDSGSGGGGGFGIGANGGSNGPGAAGAFTGGAPGGTTGPYPGGASGGGGGGEGVSTSGPPTLLLGAAGGVGASQTSGGFGGGGGQYGGNGGFGGGGGISTGSQPGGSGGFGGGGGGGDGKTAGSAGFGGGDGSTGLQGGGGLGAGGAVFVRQGASIIISDGSISGGSVVGGSGANDGQAIGSALFLAGSATYSVSSGNTVTINDTIGGGTDTQITGGFTKSGAGTLVLTGANSYTGATQINAGTLNVGSAAALGATSGITFGGGALQYSSANQTDYSSLIVNSASAISIDTNGQSVTYASGLSSSNTHGLTKLGAGTLTLSGKNTYSGATQINAGTLNVGNTAALGATGTITFGGGTLQFSSANQTDYSSLIVNSASAISIDTNGQNVTFASGLSNTNTGGLIKLGTGTLTLSGDNTYSGATGVSAGTLDITGNVGTSAGSFLVNGGSASLESGGQLTAGQLGVSGSTANPASFTQNGGTSTISTLYVAENVSATGTVSLAGGQTNISGNVYVNFRPNTSGTLNIDGGDVVVSGNVVMEYASTEAATVNLTSGTLQAAAISSFQPAASTFNFDGGTLQAGGDSASFMQGLNTANVQSGGATIDTQTYNVTIAQPLLHDTTAGAPALDGGLTKIGAGTLTLTANETYAGGTSVNAGTLVLGDGTDSASLSGFSESGTAGFTGAAGGVAVTVSSGATLQVQTNATVTGGNGQGGTEFGGMGAEGVVVNAGGSLNNAGALIGGNGGIGYASNAGNGAPGVTFNGTGTFTNTGSVKGGNGVNGNDNGGNGAAGASFTAAATFTNGGSVTGGVGGEGYTGATGGSGGAGASFSDGGSLTNTGSISGGVGGEGQYSFGGTGGNGVSFTDGGSLTNSGSISGAAGGPGFLTNAGSGAGVAFSNAAGTLVNQNGGTISDGVTMDNYANSVTLQIGSAITGGLNMGNSPASTLTLTDDGTGGTQTYSAAVGGTTAFSGQLVKNGTGTWILDESMNYGGGTMISAGTLLANNSGGSTGTGMVTIAPGAILGGDGSVGPVTVNGRITAGPDAQTVGTLTTGQETWNSNGSFLDKVAADGSSNDQLVMSDLTVAATPTDPFIIDATSTGTPTLAGLLVLARDLDPLITLNPFSPLNTAGTLSDLSLETFGIQPSAGTSFALSTQPDATTGYDLVLTESAPVPEPGAGLLLAAVGCPALLRRRRRDSQPRVAQ